MITRISGVIKIFCLVLKMLNTSDELYIYSQRVCLTTTLLNLLTLIYAYTFYSPVSINQPRCGAAVAAVVSAAGAGAGSYQPSVWWWW